MRFRGLAIAGALGCAVTISAPARSQPKPSLDLRQFQPSADPRGSLYLEPSSTPGPGNWNTAAWFSYAYRSVVLRDAAGDVSSVVVRHQTSLDLIANVGVLKHGALGIAIPSVLHQSGDSSPAVARAMDNAGLPAQALGDIAFLGKVTLVPQDELGGFGLAALGRLSLPSGSRHSFAGEGSAVSEARLLAEFRLIAVSFQATAGFRGRGAPRDFAGKTWGDELPWGVAVALKPQALGWDSKGRWTWVAETHGWLAAGPASPFSDSSVSPALAGLSARYAMGDLSLVGGAEGPLDQAAGVPLIRAVAAVHWAPRSHDIDGDKVEDDRDECPDLAEDRDGFEDADGCPDFDNDDDGVPDPDDRCPKQKEDEDGHQDDDGCPDLDNDGDRVPDEVDACPDAPGPASADRETSGCTLVDTDGDKIPDEKDRCPTDPEDRDDHEDADGCPDPDNDGDGVLDGEDRCPDSPGPASSVPKLNGCPIPDKDGDTFDDSSDRCPTESEVWNGVEDLDGCPDAGGKELLVVRTGEAGPSFELSQPLRFKGPAEAPQLEDASLPGLRAMAAELNRHPDWIVAVGARPVATQGYLASTHAMSRSFAVVLALRTYCFRDGVAETVGWSAVQDQPGAARSGIGFLVLGSQPERPAVAADHPERKP